MKARFTFMADGSAKIKKNENEIWLTKLEIKTMLAGFEKVNLTASQIGLSKDFIKFPYNTH